MDMGGITNLWHKHPLGATAGAVALAGAVGWACLAGGGREKTPVITIEEAREVVASPEELGKLPEAERHRRLRAAGQAFGAEFGARMRSGGPPPSPTAGRERGRQMRATMEKLPEADRAAFRAGLDAERRRQMQARQKEMDAKISAFFAATPAEQERLLDEEVAKMAERRQQMEKFRAAMEKERAKSGQAANGGGPGGRGGPGGPEGRPQPTREQREQWMRRGLDNSTPAERAQREEFFRRVREREAAKRK